MSENKGLQYEQIMRKRCHASATPEAENDMVSKAGMTSEVKYFPVEKAEDYKVKHAVVNRAHAHEWARNEAGQIDYLLTCEKFAREADRVVFGQGADADEQAVYLKSYRDRFNFYFCRLCWQTEKHGRLCHNPVSTQGSSKQTPGLAGRRAALYTLKKNGVVNVPTFEEIEAVYYASK